VTAAIESLGALGVFLLMVPESACVPIPSELTLLFSGVAVHQGWMSFALVVAAATVGNVVGSLIAYALGASHALDRLPFVGTAVSRWEGLLARHGTRAVFLARLLPLARTFVSLPAGARRVRLLPFVILTTAGCALWATAFVLVGLVAANAWVAIDSIVSRVTLLAVLLVVAASIPRRRRP